MSCFTSGPWHIEEENGAYGVFRGDSLLSIVIADDLPDAHSAKANAILMASAPRLLEVIKQIRDHLDNNMIVTADGYKVNDRDLRESINDAILKAEGYRL